MKTKQIVFTKINTAELIERELPEMGDNDVIVETCVSSISCGTEKANITGDLNVGIYGGPSDKFPRYLGYSSAGKIFAKGKNVTDLEIGDTVAVLGGCHRKYNISKANDVVKFDHENITMNDAALCYIGTFPMAAVRKTKLEIGESMLVMGLGILGLFAVRFAKLSGAVPVIAVDPVEERRQKALKYGADYALDPFAPDFVETVKKLTNGGVNTAVEVTGLGKGLEQTLDCMAKFGRVALLGCTRDRNFTIDYYRKVHGPGIQLIGAHTLARPSQESHPGYFTHRDDAIAILKLCEYNRMNIKEMVDEVFSPNDCFDVYTRLINDKNFPVISQFDWSDVK